MRLPGFLNKPMEKITFEIVRTEKLPDGSSELVLDVESKYQVYLAYILEALDGYCYHTIADAGSLGLENYSRHKKFLKIIAVPDYFDDLKCLLNEIRGYEDEKT